MARRFVLLEHDGDGSLVKIPPDQRLLDPEALAYRAELRHRLEDEECGTAEKLRRQRQILSRTAPDRRALEALNQYIDCTNSEDRDWFIEYDGHVHPLIRALYTDVDQNEVIFVYISYDSAGNEYMLRKSRNRHQITRIARDRPEDVLLFIEAEYAAVK